MIPRKVLDQILPRIGKNKAILVIGARQVGKSTLLRMIVESRSGKVIYWDGDEPDIRARVSEATSDYLKQQIGDASILVIDEAQRIKNIGITVKLIIDKIPGVQVLVSGSSALELSNDINEPLTGRKYEYNLMALSTGEMIDHHGVTNEQRLLNHRLVYGMYPEIVTKPGEEAILLKNLASSYLYKDVFNFQDVRKPEVFEKLLNALALQLSNEISYNELAQVAGTDPATVQRYIDLLEKTFIVFRLPSLSRNIRNELKKSRKVYFYDNGIRNAVIGDYRSLELRTDIGALWENYLVGERLKLLENNGIQTSRYFWRTAQQQEIDYLEEREGILYAFEFKWSAGRKVLFPKTFREAYRDHVLKTVTPENYIEFLTQV
jgi:predicted AAA+ superfamily ATPase